MRISLFTLSAGTLLLNYLQNFTQGIKLYSVQEECVTQVDEEVDLAETVQDRCECEEVDLAETVGDCESEDAPAVCEDQLTDELLAETSLDVEQVDGTHEMSAINLIENERNMHILPPPMNCCQNYCRNMAQPTWIAPTN